MVKPDLPGVEATHLAVVKKLVGCIARRDREGVKGCLTEDVVLNVPGRTLISGTFQGVDEVMEALGRFAEMAGESLQVKLHDLLANGEHGVVLYEVKAERDGKTIEYSQIDVYHFRDGRVSEITGWESNGFSELYS